MTAPKRLIEVDEQTTVALEAGAAERGLSVPALVAETAACISSTESPSIDDIDELDRRWARIEAGEPTVPDEAVVRWRRTWESPTSKS